MSNASKPITGKRIMFAGIVVAVAAVATAGMWWPAVDGWVDSVVAANRPADSHDDHGHAGQVHDGFDHASHDDHDHDYGDDDHGAHPNTAHSEHDGHDHTAHADHAGHDHEGHDHSGHDHGGHEHNDATAIELSVAAMRNLGLVDTALKPVYLRTFDKSITMPATIVDQPGRTHLQISAPFTGVVTKVQAIQGEALLPGATLLEMRLTHEDLVQAQTDFLKTLGELDVEKKEIARLEKVTSSGAVAGRVLLEREYARDKLAAVLSAQREALLLHGLSEDQVDVIANERRLLRAVRIMVPEPGAEARKSFQLTGEGFLPVAFDEPEPETTTPLTLDQILVQTGQAVQTGEPLCILSNLSALYVEAFAFEQDAAALAEAVTKNRKVDAIFDLPNRGQEVIDNLTIRFLDNQINPDTRTLSAFIELPNEIVRDSGTESKPRFVSWKHRPGQRLQLRVPVERWQDRFVLPVDAVAREGAESFVFVRNGDHFDRVPVVVEHRDQFNVVIPRKGGLSPGSVVALRGAHQMQMALKNKAGGGVDPHAGHTH